MTFTPLEPELAAPLPKAVDLRLVVSDMDGTLMNAAGKPPAGLAAGLEAMRAAGVIFTPASGRQLANLRAVLGPQIAQCPIIAENGTLVVQGDEEIYSVTITPDQARTAVNTVRELSRDNYDVGAVVACKDCAYVERKDATYVEEVALYYQALEVVDDLLELPLDTVIKVAVYDFDDVEQGSAQKLGEAVPSVQTVVSGKHWVDMMPAQASKGRALAALQKRLGITPAQTAVFGDYLNDLDLYDHADLAFAMRNAHPGIHAVAKYTAPANTEDGVLRMIAELLARKI